MKHSNVIIILLMIFSQLLFFGCNGSGVKKTQLMQLAHQEANLNCELKSIKEKITIAWDEVNMILEQKLPEDMPEEEKRNMIGVRNAGLIRMFQSYQTLDQSIKDKLTNTEKMDMKMSKEIVKINKEKEKIDLLKLNLETELKESLGETELVSITQKYQKILDDKCNM